MDLYTLMSLQAFLLVPFMCYFLFFKKNGGRSLYTGRDIFYPLKYQLAKRVVKAAQEKSKRSRKKLIKKGIEPEITFASQQSNYFQSFSGCDQKGNSLKLKFTLMPNKSAEVILVLKLANGSIYTFPGSQKVHITSIKENKWKINGLIIENLEPYKRLRIVYNGLLQNVYYKSYEKIEHVQFNFIFNCCSAPKFYPEDCDTGLISETLATKTWKDASWKTFLNNHRDGYEQFGVLMGFVKGESFTEEEILNLPSCRSRYGGPDEGFLLHREIKVFLAETNGILVNLTLQSFKEDSQLNYGYICHKNFKTVPISGQDMRINNLGRNKTLPNLFKALINTNSDEYTCVFNLNKNSASVHEPSIGVEVFNVSAECDVNVSKGRALLEFQYYESTRNEKPAMLAPILSEKKVGVLPKDYVVSIKNKAARILELTGGKGTSLALLTSLGSDEFLVPDGFIITVNAFKRQIAESKSLQEAVKDVDDAFCGRRDARREEVCALAVRLLTNEPVHPELAKDIIEGLSQVKKDCANDAIDVVSWAVRSSAIGEDSEELSAAGQNETILGCVTEHDILKAVAKCWASLFAYQSAYYRWQHGMPISSDMAVVVQKMVPAETAGVLFTWHPSSSNPSQMVITSNFGLGESVVSGKSDPDTFILNRTYDGKLCILDQVMGAKDKVLTLTKDGVKEFTSNGPEASFEFVNGKDATENWSLSKEQVLKLGRIGLRLEESFGGPRDIEWAFYKRELYLLQSRPITTLNTWTDWELTHEFDTPVVTENSLYTVANCGEVFPIAVSPLCRSDILYNMDRGMQKYINQECDPYLFKCICTFQHRVMIDCILSLYMNERKEKVQMGTKVLDLAIMGHPVINEKINLIVRTRLGPMPRFRMLKETIRRWNDSRKIKEYVSKSTEFVKTIDFGIDDADDVNTVYDKIVNKDDGIFVPLYYHSIASSTSVFWQMVCMMMLIENKEELTTDLYADFANILSSCDDVESAEVPLYLEKIAKLIKEEGYEQEFCTIKPEFGVRWLQAKCPAAHKIFTDFLQRHGHRCIGEFELLSETWSLNPSQVIPMIQANAKHMREVVKEYKSINQVISDLETSISFVTKKILNYTLGKLRVAVGKREQSKSAAIMAIHKFRLAYRRLAKQMAQEGKLPSESLIFFLTKFELGEVIKRTSPLLITKAIKRQKLYLKWNTLKFPELNYSLPEPEKEFEIPVELLPGTKCLGTPVCTGTVQARACVISHLDEIASLEKGDILITYSTDIGWSPYFPMLSGVVTELGGLVSHGAVVAREYGLPCIVGVKNATKIFKTGDIVHLSGKTGELGKV